MIKKITRRLGSGGYAAFPDGSIVTIAKVAENNHDYAGISIRHSNGFVVRTTDGSDYEVIKGDHEIYLRLVFVERRGYSIVGRASRDVVFVKFDQITDEDKKRVIENDSLPMGRVQGIRRKILDGRVKV